MVEILIHIPSFSAYTSHMKKQHLCLETTPKPMVAVSVIKFVTIVQLDEQKL